MSNPMENALDLLTGRWRAQILYTGVKLGIVDHLGNNPQTAAQVAAALGLHASNTYRLMRGMASAGVLTEDSNQTFELTEMGQFFRADHPASMRGACLWEEGPAMYSAWRHLPDIVREGGETGSVREFGMPIFGLITTDEEVGTTFNNAMTSYSARETDQVLTALDTFDTSALATICDIGGGQGHLLCHLLLAHPHLTGTVFELPETLERPDTLLAGPLGVAERCTYQAGDMFAELPGADAYVLKHILHDWNDEECIQILRNAHSASGDAARIMIVEYVVPGPDTPDFAKLFDVHMMSVLTGKERTESEFADILERSGWQFNRTWAQPQGSLAVVEGIKP